LRVLDRGRPGETYNIGGNNEKRNIVVVQTICDVLDEKVGPLSGKVSRRDLITFVKDRVGHDRRYAIDAGKIRNELGWKPTVTFEDGIRQTIDWYLNNADWSASIMDGSYQEYYRKMYRDL
jgi:dTDP-glucose 4,6-dehydratase